MKWWGWLTTPDPDPGFTVPKLLKLMVRVMLFALVATLLSTLLQLTPLGPYLNTWWGSLLFVLALYIPLARFMSVDTFVPRRLQARADAARGRSATGQRSASSAQRRKERNRYAGVRKGAPKYGGRR
ncbi:hypothetical protein CBQ26_12350 [Deinococcus indicus]|uniref:Uncharacterized protein n=1 Tax=Deinococcus indicus TaxID=223556 RepID=A0A246BJA2_9DEIO|nr:hypothetical protein [Deinococcus indicus]OWL95381.1 hypothetical protein CBQ26_12350 [Deinococcus indicus]GHG31117.1 hypothetical protein GCM10017784_25340 [Deinococcus indicus]